MMLYARVRLARLVVGQPPTPAPCESDRHSPDCVSGRPARTHRPLPLHRTEAGYPHCSTCDGGGCYDCTDPA
jgi:hypothetical protein